MDRDPNYSRHLLEKAKNVTTNLICSVCGTDYYSASPDLAVETTECDNGCGLTLVKKED